jgi:hypothetical protein
MSRNGFYVDCALTVPPCMAGLARSLVTDRACVDPRCVGMAGSHALNVWLAALCQNASADEFTRRWC